MINMWDGTNYFFQDILHFQPRVIFESYTFYPIWRQYFDPRVILGWRYIRVSTVPDLFLQIQNSLNLVSKLMTNQINTLWMEFEKNAFSNLQACSISLWVAVQFLWRRDSIWKKIKLEWIVELPDGDWSTSGRVNSCRVSMKVGCLPWSKRPTLA